MFLLKIVLVVVLALVLEKPTTRTRTKTICAFSRGAAEGTRASLFENGNQATALVAGRKSPTESRSSQERPLEEFQRRKGSRRGNEADAWRNPPPHVGGYKGRIWADIQIDAQKRL
jgi:hypothetical protein